jgi:hypothetical protein
MQFNAREFLDTGIHRTLFLESGPHEYYDLNITLVENEYFYVYYNHTSFDASLSKTFFAAPGEPVLWQLFRAAGQQDHPDIAEMYGWTPEDEGTAVLFSMTSTDRRVLDAFAGHLPPSEN